ncbi:MAG TPA: hypothetical protein VML50_11815 [Anaeromyxobacter sp.]|nr:hypothetical protein [Anaeromyxobacter sp.]
MKATRLAPLALASLALAACSGVKVTPTGAVAGPPRPADCPVPFLREKPLTPYVPLAQLEDHVTAVPKGGALEVLRPKACELGADAVIIEREQVLNEFGHTLVVGTAIKYQLAVTAEPPPPAAPAPASPPATAPATPPAAAPPAPPAAPAPANE